MQPTGRFGQRLRILLFVILLVGLGGLLFSAGTIGPNSALNDYPGNNAVISDSSAHVGLPVTLGGTVVATSPTTIEVESETGESMHVTLRNVDREITSGDEVVAFGTLEDETTLTVNRATVRSPWEFTYMYIVSFLGGLLVLGRLATQWRFYTTTLAFRPRGDDDA